MMISQPPRSSRPDYDDSDVPDQAAASENTSPDQVDREALQSGEAVPEGGAERAILDELGGPVPDFLRAAQVLRSATEDIIEQVQAPPSPSKRGRRRSNRAPLLKQDDSARLRQMLAEMASLTPAEPAPSTGYRPEMSSAFERPERGFSAARIMWLLRNSPVLAIGLVALFGLAGGLGYIAFGVRASVPPAACSPADACAPAAYEASAEITTPPPQSAPRPVQPAPIIAAPVQTLTAPPKAAVAPAPATPTPMAEAVAALPEAATPETATDPDSTVSSLASPTVVLRPSQPATDLSLPAPEPLAIPLDAMATPDADAAEPAPSPAEPKERTETALVDGSALNVRSGPSKDSRKLFVLSADQEVAVLETDNSWTRVRTADGRVGWVYSTLTDTTPRRLQPASDASPKSDTAAGTPTNKIKRGGVTVRAGAGKGNKAVFNLSGGEAVTVLEKKDGWVRIKDRRGRTGWAYGDFVVGL